MGLPHTVASAARLSRRLHPRRPPRRPPRPPRRRCCPPPVAAVDRPVVAVARARLRARAHACAAKKNNVWAVGIEHAGQPFEAALPRSCELACSVLHALQQCYDSEASALTVSGWN